MTSGTKVHTFEEVAKHDKKGDCWLIISGKVYDLSSFMDDHPGGDDVILTATGKDATNDFEDVGHSDDARDMMKKYYVGEIDSSSIPAEVKKPTPTPTLTAGGAAAGSSTVNQTSENIIKILQFLLPLLILGLAYAYREYTKKE